MRVIAEIHTDDGMHSTVAAFHTLTEMREAAADAAERHGPLTADVYRWPGDDYPSVDVPTWRIIRTEGQRIGSEHFPPETADDRAAFFAEGQALITDALYGGAR